MTLIRERSCSAPTQGRPIRWTARQKAAVVLAVTCGRATVADVERRYGVSAGEFREWQRRAAQGLRALEEISSTPSGPKSLRGGSIDVGITDQQPTICLFCPKLGVFVPAFAWQRSNAYGQVVDGASVGQKSRPRGVMGTGRAHLAGRTFPIYCLRGLPAHFESYISRWVLGRATS